MEQRRGKGEAYFVQWSVVASYAAGLHGMTRNLALDLKPIRVNLVSLGAIDTEFWAHMSAEQKGKMFKGISTKVPTGKIGMRKCLIVLSLVNFSTLGRRKKTESWANGM